MSEKSEVLSRALKMTPSERVEIIDQLMKSLDKPDPEIDKIWKKEAEERVRAFEKGEIESISLKDVIEKYKKL